MYEIITCDKELLNKVVEENNLDKLAGRHIKNWMKEVKEITELSKKTIKKMIEEKKIDIKEISELPLKQKGVRSYYNSKEVSEFLDKDKYPLLSIYLTPDPCGRLVKREIMSQLNTELGELKRALKPILKQNIEKFFSYSDEEKKKALKFLAEDKSITYGVSGVDEVPYGKFYDAVYHLFEFSDFGKTHDLDMIISYKKGHLFISVLDFDSIKSAIENQNYKYFEILIDEHYEKEYQESLRGAKTELLKGSLGQAITKAIIGEAESRNYKSTGFIDEEHFACMEIEAYSRELGAEWEKLADKSLGYGEVKRFNPENAEKILKVLEQMKANPKETTDNVNRLLAENLSDEYEIDEQWMTQILNQIIEVVNESVNKNLELVICQTYE